MPRENDQQKIGEPLKRWFPNSHQKQKAAESLRARGACPPLGKEMSFIVWGAFFAGYIFGRGSDSDWIFAVANIAVFVIGFHFGAQSDQEYDDLTEKIADEMFNPETSRTHEEIKKRYEDQRGA